MGEHSGEPKEDDDMPPMKVVHITEAHHYTNCGAVCPSCVRTDERRLGRFRDWRLDRMQSNWGRAGGV